MMVYLSLMIAPKLRLHRIYRPLCSNIFKTCSRRLVSPYVVRTKTASLNVNIARGGHNFSRQCSHNFSKGTSAYQNIRTRMSVMAVTAGGDWNGSPFRHSSKTGNRTDWKLGVERRRRSGVESNFIACAEKIVNAGEGKQRRACTCRWH